VWTANEKDGVTSELYFFVAIKIPLSAIVGMDKALS
jgi:hypothetical protein